MAKAVLTFALYQGDSFERRETVTQDIVKVGKDPKSHLRVDDELASRMHAVIEVAGPEDITLIDLGNEPGTMVNGARVNKCKLHVGDQIQVGDTKIILESAEAAGAEAAPPPPSREPSIVDVMKARVGTFAPNKFTNAIQRSTISLTWFRSGVGDPPKINVIPSVAEAGLDCRVLPGTTRDQWIAEIRGRLGDPSIAIELINESDDPIVTTADSPLFRNIEAAIRRRHSDAVVTPMLIPYGTDSNAFRPKGVKSYGIFPAILSAETVASMHGDAERVPLDGVAEAAQVFFEALRDTLRDVQR